jgi:hypothetical protein
MDHEKLVAEINKAIEEIINAILDENPELARNIYGKLVSASTSFPILCMNCVICYDLYFHMELLDGLFSEKVTLKEARQRIQAWKYSKYTDFANKSLKDAGRGKFARTPATTSKNIIYPDQNIFSLFVNNEEVRENILRIKSNGSIQFVYSPSHLEEVHKIDESKQQRVFLKAITEITENISLQPAIDDTISLFTEDPAYPLDREAASSLATEAVELIKTLKDEDRFLYFEKYNDDNHRKLIASNIAIFDSLSSDDFSTIMFVCASNNLYKEQFKGLRAHSDIRNAIYALHDALDLLSFKREKSERTTRSSVHDVEHLIYAAKSSTFITNDKRLKARASQIYSFLGFEVKVQNLDDFLKTSK